MANEPGTFDEQSLKRIERTVLWVEAQIRNLSKWPRFQTRRGWIQPNQAIAGTQLAVVTVAAPPSIHTTGTKYYKIEADSGEENGGKGKAILLDQLKNGEELLAEWESLTDPDGTGTDFTIEDLEFWVVSIYDNVPLEVGKLIRVYNVPPPEITTQSGSNYQGGFGGRVTSGSEITHSDGDGTGTDITVTVDKTPALGEYTNPDDYHRAKDTWNENVDQILHHLAKVGTGSEVQQIIWDGGECGTGGGTGT